MLKRLLELHLVVSLGGYFDSIVKLIDEDVVPQVMLTVLTEVQSFSRDVLPNLL